MEQRSKEWFEARRGRFTGSSISKLMGIQGLGKTGKTYAFEKAYEIVFGVNEEDNFSSFDMKRGTELEPIAFAKFKELKGLEFITVEETSFFTKGDNSGASPDGLVNNDGVLEIKCPKPAKFFKLVIEGEKAIDKDYIDQMQMEMDCTSSTVAYFFNYIIYNGIPMWHEIIIKLDPKRVELINKRIDEAVIIRDEYAEQLRLKKQF
jgi:putative phage-type endonuclease